MSTPPNLEDERNSLLFWVYLRKKPRACKTSGAGKASSNCCCSYWWGDAFIKFIELPLSCFYLYLSMDEARLPLSSLFQESNDHGPLKNWMTQAAALTSTSWSTESALHAGNAGSWDSLGG